MSSHLRDTCLDTLTVRQQIYHYYSLPKAAKTLGNIDKLPKSLKVLLENLLRHQDGDTVEQDDLQAVVDWLKIGHADREIAYRPARVLMQDFTGVPAVVDLAAMRAAVKRLGGDVNKVNPLSPVDLVIDHSVTVDHFGDRQALADNTQLEMARNRERYEFLRWGQNAFSHFSVVPPGTGICHQVNLEYLAKAIWYEKQGDKQFAYPDTLVGTDSHTTMINGLGVLGWGVGGIEAEAAMLGQPVSMLIPDVVGVKLSGKMQEGITATDLVLTVTQMLRKHGVVGKFVEFYGDGLDSLPLADRATIANMAPEYGATCGFFPIDHITLDYMRLTNRAEEQIALVEAYSKQQGLWRNAGDEPVFTSQLALDLATVETSLAGPKRPQDRVPLAGVPEAFKASRELDVSSVKNRSDYEEFTLEGETHRLHQGAVVIAAITSCTNTSNPSVLMTAGLLAKNAVERGLKTKPWVKTSLAPGSRVVTDYYAKAELTPYLDELGFNLVGYGCTTCIGNSGPLPDAIEAAIKEGDLTVGAVLSGNRNFEGRIHPLVKTNWLASPPLVVAYALAGNMNVDLTQQPLGEDRDGKAVYLKDIWPSTKAVADAVLNVNAGMFHKQYAAVFEGTQEWQDIEVDDNPTYQWPEESTYIRQTPFFLDMGKEPEPVQDIHKARILAMLGDSVTTDHISPAGNIKRDSPAGKYLLERGVETTEFNSYGSRRGNHEVMMRGTFANIRIRNEMVPGKEGGYTRHIPSQNEMTIYDAAMRYKEEGVSLALFAGKEYGSGSSRDWAAKGPRLLGVRVVIAESFERIHRSNLIGMGILPLEFPDGVTRKTLQLTGDEQISITGLNQLAPGATVEVNITDADGNTQVINTRCRIDTRNELTYYQNDGILHYVIRNML
ncbi:aconitate hydratase 1 [Pectobacterium atrosepticum SCRI1043]|uniref:Aconitate hydratase n=2 Tax=Pectobacterium atrosepticum TaxID=29471 RepID=Q6D5U7_PECAS|nr:aconitate hydratase AcnA [Pectobacterium atrosepticum]GKV83960.1 aconitate hydratase [Pectobacterium carotovorum subsp. carotovorum]AIA70780.1 aconitate hydratase [Pectobacterium atrosepticum]AIK14448.1 aconitate hydratase 1 [Pectobacterium atrosepticum]ATY91200.1 aconitate hydratase AcnA [Pectobacterium atrosepticum]KFX17864.1 aconitate hydratase [Pectobacterium atrosepticum]